MIFDDHKDMCITCSKSLRSSKGLERNEIIWCNEFDVIFEEKAKRHFHIWIMPRHKWMSDLVGDISDNIGVIFDYAKKNYRTKEVFDNIERITKIVAKEFKEV